MKWNAVRKTKCKKKKNAKKKQKENHKMEYKI